MWEAIVNQVIVPFVAAGVLSLGAWAAAVFQKKTGVEIDARMREAFQTALGNAAGLLLNKDEATVRNMSAAVNYVANSAPDAVKYFGLDDNDIATRVDAKIGQIAAKP